MGRKYFERETLQLFFLLSAKDSAFDMTLLKECSSLLIVGAVSFSTFSSAYRNLTAKRERNDNKYKVITYLNKKVGV